jgi:hypothetical protein
MTDDPATLALPFTLRRGTMYQLTDGVLEELIGMLITDNIPTNLMMPATSTGDDDEPEVITATYRDHIRFLPTMVMFSENVQDLSREWNHMFDLHLKAGSAVPRVRLDAASAVVAPGNATVILTQRRKTIAINDVGQYEDVNVIRDAWMSGKLVKAREMALAIMPQCWPVLLACCELERANQD